MFFVFFAKKNYKLAGKRVKMNLEMYKNLTISDKSKTTLKAVLMTVATTA